jgi:putative heme transporter
MFQSRTLQMHPAVILVAITAGASVAGVLGMLLSVPMTAAVFGVVSELRGRYEEPPTAAEAPEPQAVDDSASGEDEPPRRPGRRSRRAGETTGLPSRLPRRLKGRVSGA